MAEFISNSAILTDTRLPVRAYGRGSNQPRSRKMAEFEAKSAKSVDATDTAGVCRTRDCG